MYGTIGFTASTQEWQGAAVKHSPEVCQDESLHNFGQQHQHRPRPIPPDVKQQAVAIHNLGQRQSPMLSLVPKYLKSNVPNLVLIGTKPIMLFKWPDSSVQTDKNLKGFNLT